MNRPLDQKSSLQQIQARFDADVERFSNVDTGQASALDAPLMLELVTQAAVAATPVIGRVLDIGCGAGNQTIRLLRESGGTAACDLNDLSLPMLERARERLGAETTGEVRTLPGDFRTLEAPEEGYDVILAGAVLHHLRGDEDWTRAFQRLHALLRGGGSVWISDLVSHGHPAIQRLMWSRYGDFLEAQGGSEYRDQVLAYIDEEDSPRSVTFQLELLREVGFAEVELLHKNSCFAAFGAIKAAD